MNKLTDSGADDLVLALDLLPDDLVHRVPRYQIDDAHLLRQLP